MVFYLTAAVAVLLLGTIVVCAAMTGTEYDRRTDDRKQEEFLEEFNKKEQN